MGKESDSTIDAMLLANWRFAVFGLRNNAFNQAIEIGFVFFTQVSRPWCSSSKWVG